MYNGLLAFQYKTGDLSTITLGLGMTFRQMTHQAVNSVSGTEPQFKAMVMMALIGYDYDTNTVSETPADAVSVVIVDPDTVNCLGDADYFISQGSPVGSPYSGLMAFQRKTGDLSTTTLGFGNVAEQMQNLAVSGAGGLDASFKSMLLISWVGYDYGTNTVSETPADAVSVTIEDPSTLNCLGDAATFIGISGGGGGGSVEGTSVLSTGETAGLVLTSNGDNSSSWQPPSAPVYNGGNLPLTFNQGVGSINFVYSNPPSTEILFVKIPAMSGVATSNGFLVSSNALPAPFRPSVNLSYIISVSANGVNAAGVLTIGSNGIVTIYASAALAQFVSGQAFEVAETYVTWDGSL